MSATVLSFLSHRDLFLFTRVSSLWLRLLACRRRWQSNIAVPSPMTLRLGPAGHDAHGFPTNIQPACHDTTDKAAARNSPRRLRGAVTRALGQISRMGQLCRLVDRLDRLVSARDLHRNLLTALVSELSCVDTCPLCRQPTALLGLYESQWLSGPITNDSSSHLRPSLQAAAVVTPGAALQMLQGLQGVGNVWGCGQCGVSIFMPLVPCGVRERSCGRFSLATVAHLPVFPSASSSSPSVQSSAAPPPAAATPSPCFRCASCRDANVACLQCCPYGDPAATPGPFCQTCHQAQLCVECGQLQGFVGQRSCCDARICSECSRMPRFRRCVGCGHRHTRVLAPSAPRRRNCWDCNAEPSWDWPLHRMACCAIPLCPACLEDERRGCPSCGADLWLPNTHGGAARSARAPQPPVSSPRVSRLALAIAAGERLLSFSPDKPNNPPHAKPTLPARRSDVEESRRLSTQEKEHGSEETIQSTQERGHGGKDSHKGRSSPAGKRRKTTRSRTDHGTKKEQEANRVLKYQSPPSTLAAASSATAAANSQNSAKLQSQ
eukprot:g81429.t1